MKKILLAFLFLLFSSVVANASTPGKEVCSGFAKWMDDGTFKQIRESKCMSEAEYQAYINSPDYMCKYLAKSIWKESERAYGKKQYQYTENKLKKIKALKDEGIALCNGGKLKDGEAKLREAFNIISHTRMN